MESVLISPLVYNKLSFKYLPMGGKIQGVVTNETKGTVYYTVTNHYLKIIHNQ